MRAERLTSFLTERRLKQARYVLSSGISVMVGQATLGVAFGVLRWRASVSNVVSFLVAGVVAYVLHRRWTWRRRGRSSLVAEVVPSWGIALISLVLSTWLVDLVAGAGADAGLGRATVTLLVMGTALVVNGAFWVVKFVVMDRWLFADRARTG